MCNFQPQAQTKNPTIIIKTATCHFDYFGDMCYLKLAFKLEIVNIKKYFLK